jgi:acetyl-CoA carboxylase carboxyl transferase subunit alpha
MLPQEKQVKEYENLLSLLKQHNSKEALLSDQELGALENRIEELKKKIYSKLTAWDRVCICRHPQRPKAIDYIEHVVDSFVELCGDRLFRDDPAVICGFGIIDGKKVMIIAQEKGCDTESRIKRNFGMPHPEGYRKAIRCMRLAAKFNIPVVTLLDTPGAYPGLTAEERGQGWAIASNLWEMARLATPIIVLLIGEGCSGGALGMGVGDEIAMLEHAYYSVISPEGCASILWKDTSKNATAAAALKMQAEDLKKLGIIDSILPEPMGGAHLNPQSMYSVVKKYLSETLDTLEGTPLDLLLENRYQKFRRMGRFQTEGAPRSGKTVSKKLATV